MEPAIAAGTGIVIVFINALSGTAGFIRQHRVLFRIGGYIAVGALPGSLIGIWILHYFNSDYFFIVFSIILILLGVFLLYKNLPFSKAKPFTDSYKSFDFYKKQIIQFLCLGFIMGIFSSYLGIGGGWMLVPILIYIFKIPAHYATATSIFSLLIYSSYSVLAQIIYQSVDWGVVVWGTVGIIIDSQIGVIVSNKISSKIIMQMLSILLIVMGVRMIF